MAAERQLELGIAYAPRIGDWSPGVNAHTPRSRVTVELSIPQAEVERFYDLYVAAFGPLRALAVARHVLHADEFAAQLADPRLWKLVAWDEHDQPCGLTTLTRDLTTVPWISPEYFAAKYPEQWSRNAVYYWGFTLTTPDQRRQRHFLAMMTAVADFITADKGVCGYDICAFNNSTMALGQRVEEMLHQLTSASFEVIDTQTYYCATVL